VNIIVVDRLDDARLYLCLLIIPMHIFLGIKNSRFLVYSAPFFNEYHLKVF